MYTDNLQSQEVTAVNNGLASPVFVASHSPRTRAKGIDEHSNEDCFQQTLLSVTKRAAQLPSFYTTYSKHRSLSANQALRTDQTAVKRCAQSSKRQHADNSERELLWQSCRRRTGTEFFFREDVSCFTLLTKRISGTTPKALHRT